MNEVIDLARGKKVPFKVMRGQVIDIAVSVNNADGTPYDFTGHSAEMFVYNSFNKTDSPEYEIDVTLSLGVMQFDHEAITRRKEDFVYQLWMTDDTGYRQVWTNGDFLVLNREVDHQSGEETITISPNGDDIIITISPVSAGDVHYRGVYTTLVALQAAVPTGNPGDYADIDSGVGSDIQRYIWDDNDNEWLLGSGSGEMTGAEIITALGAQSANRVLAGPSSGAAAEPTFRALVADDLPSLPVYPDFVFKYPLDRGVTTLVGSINKFIRLKNSTVDFSEGSILIGGSFTNLFGVSMTGQCMISKDGRLGSVQYTLGGGAQIRDVAEAADGGFIVVGDFTIFNDDDSVTQTRIFKFTSALIIDSSFVTGTGFDAQAYKVLVLSSGKIVVTGAFTTYNGTAVPQIVVLNLDGSIDSSFNPGTGFTSGIPLGGIRYFDNKLLITGNFTTYNGTAVNRIVRINLDGSIDSSFITGTSFGGSTRDAYIYEDGRILVAGFFTSYNGTTKNCIIRLNSDGSIDTSFDPGTGFSLSVGTKTTTALIVEDNRIYVSGNFDAYNGTTTNHFVILNGDGTIYKSFPIGFAGGQSSAMDLIDKHIFVGGLFTTFQGFTVNRFIRLDLEGNISGEFDRDTTEGTIALESTTGRKGDIKFDTANLYVCIGNNLWRRTPLTNLTAGSFVGAQDLFIPASGMTPRGTSGCAILAPTEISGSLVNIQTLAFDGTTQQFAQFTTSLPRNWDRGTIKAKVFCIAASGSGNVVWGISGGAYGTADALTTALGTAQTVTIAVTSTAVAQSSFSASITIAGSPADGDLLVIQISRNPADAADTLNGINCKLVGVTFELTTDAGVAA